MKKPHLIIPAAAILVVGGIYAWRTLTPSSPSSTSSNNQSPISNPQSPILTPAVAALLSKDPIPLPHRLATLSTLGDQLPAFDRAALLAAITNTPPKGLTNDDWFTLANDILQALRNQQPATPEYTDRLIALWHDKNLDPTLRDYVLQQLREWITDSDTRTAQEIRPEKIALIRQTFLDAVTPGHPTCDLQSTTTGTALLALDEWIPTSSSSTISNSPASSPPDFSTSSLHHLLLSHSADPAAHRGLRATALQLCARRKITGALPIARAILADTSTDAILRISAISLIGTLGTPEDQALLTTFQRQNPTDPLLQSSLAKALLCLSKKSDAATK